MFPWVAVPHVLWVLAHPGVPLRVAMQLSSGGISGWRCLAAEQALEAGYSLGVNSGGTGRCAAADQDRPFAPWPAPACSARVSDCQPAVASPRETGTADVQFP